MALFRRQFQPRHGPTTETSLSSSSCSASSVPGKPPRVSEEEEEDAAAVAIKTTTPSPTSLMSLPPEIHLAVSRFLIYPDALSLKHTNRNFYNIVDTSIQLKVEWLIERRSLHLECPNDRKCELGSDLRFCRGSVPLLMRRRREHMECESRPGLGCLVYGTKSCAHKVRLTWWKRWFKVRFTVELWWIVLALVPVLFAWMWMLEIIRAVSL